MSTRIEWLAAAREDLARLGKPEAQRITDALGRLRFLDDPRQRLLPYSENLKGFWKLRVGDYRVNSELREEGDRVVLVIQVVHRGTAYSARNVRLLKRRAEDD